MKGNHLFARRGSWIPGVLTLAVLLGRPVVAWACTLAPYEEVFVPSGTVPADGFAAEIGDPSRSMPALLDEAGAAVELVTTQGPGARWTVRPARALVPAAHYTFHFQRAKRLDPSQSDPQTVELTTGPAAPPPDSAGALHVQADPPDAASGTQFFHVAWERAAALQPYASLLEFHFMVDGAPLSTLSSSATEATISGACESAQPAKDSCGDIWTVTAGPHTVTLTARLFGMDASLPALSASIDVACSTPIPGGNGVVDPDAPRHGCAVAGGSSDAALTGIAAAALSLVLSRRKRRG